MTQTTRLVNLLLSTSFALSPAISADWTAKRVYDPIKDESHCVAESIPQRMHDGYQDTTVTLRLDNEALLIATKSNIDPAEPQAGIKVGHHELIRMDRVHREQNALFETRIKDIIQQFDDGLRVEVALKFWPTWPNKGIKSTHFSLVGFRKAFAQLPDC
jgi:hypothetical protein